jgi:hypothetical protein
VYDMYPWGDPADSASADPRNSEHRNSEHRNSEHRHVPAPCHVPGPRHVPADESAAALRAVQVALDRRDNGGDGMAAAGQATASVTR